MDAGSLEFFSVSDLVSAFPGTTRKIWVGKLIPRLKADRVIGKVGKKIVGRRAQIEAAIVAMGERGAL